MMDLGVINKLQEVSFSTINVSISLGNTIISQSQDGFSKDGFNRSDELISDDVANITDVDYGTYLVDTTEENKNKTITLSKNKILIWIGNYAINSERVAIFILFAGLLFLFALILQSWRKDVINKRKYKQYQKAQQDLPPTYTELVSRKNPPAYKESLMQVSPYLPYHLN